jgi:hypothetical protein
LNRINKNYSAHLGFELEKVERHGDMPPVRLHRAAHRRDARRSLESKARAVNFPGPKVRKPIVSTVWPFRGATGGGEPESIALDRWLWIPGSRAKARAPE